MPFCPARLRPAAGWPAGMGLLHLGGGRGRLAAGFALGSFWGFFDFFPEYRNISYLCSVDGRCRRPSRLAKLNKNQQIMAKGTIALGQFRGKVGGQVLRVVDGQQVIQNYQPVVRNPRTTAQEKQRAALKTMGKLVRSFLSVIRVSFGGPYAGGNFVKSNISRLAGVLTFLLDDEINVSYPALNITNDTAGGRLTVSAGGPDFGQDQHLKIGIPIANIAVSADLNRSNVRIYGVAYCPDREIAVLSNPTMASDDTVIVNAPADWDGMTVHAWLFATCATGEIDPDAFDQENSRLPYITSAGYYAGSGELA